MKCFPHAHSIFEEQTGRHVHEFFSLLESAQNTGFSGRSAGLFARCAKRHRMHGADAACAAERRGSQVTFKPLRATTCKDFFARLTSTKYRSFKHAASALFTLSQFKQKGPEPHSSDPFIVFFNRPRAYGPSGRPSRRPSSSRASSRKNRPGSGDRERWCSGSHPS